MPVNKNFPNYKRPLIVIKVVSSHPRGDNRSARRKMASFAHRQPEIERAYDARLLLKENRDMRRDKISARHMANRLRADGRRAKLKAKSILK